MKVIPMWLLATCPLNGGTETAPVVDWWNPFVLIHGNWSEPEKERLLRFSDWGEAEEDDVIADLFLDEVIGAAPDSPEFRGETLMEIRVLAPD